MDIDNRIHTDVNIISSYTEKKRFILHFDY